MKGYTLVELLTVISFVELLETGALEGKRSGILGVLIGLFVGLLIASLWIGLFYSWLLRNLKNVRPGISTWLFLLTMLFMLLALPVMAWTITHRLTTPSTASFP